MVDYRLRDLSGPSRRRFIKWMGALGAAVGVERARMLNFFGDAGGSAFADGMACAGVNRSVHVVGGNGSFAWFQLLWPFPQIAQAGSSTFAYHAPNEGYLYSGGNKPFYYGPEAPWKTAGTPNAPGAPLTNRAVSGFMSGGNETHTQTPTTTGVIASNAGMVAAVAAVQREVPTLLPTIGVGPVNLGAANGAPSVANVADANGMVDLFNSAASIGTLALQADRDLYETYYKAVIGLREGTKLPTWTRHMDVTKAAVHVLGKNLATQLTPSAADLNTYGLNTLASSAASAEAKTKLANFGRALITTAKAFKMNLTMSVQIALNPGAAGADFGDCHAAFNNMLALRATTVAMQTMFNAFYNELAAAPDPACTAKNLADTVIFTAHGDTPKTPLNRSGWPDNTPGNTNWIYVMGSGHLKNGWFGQVMSNGTTSGFDPTTGMDVAGKPSTQTARAAGAAVLYAVSKGKMSVVNEYYPSSEPSIAGIVV